MVADFEMFTLYAFHCKKSEMMDIFLVFRYEDTIAGASATMGDAAAAAAAAARWARSLQFCQHHVPYASDFCVL